MLGAGAASGPGNYLPILDIAFDARTAVGMLKSGDVADQLVRQADGLVGSVQQFVAIRAGIEQYRGPLEAARHAARTFALDAQGPLLTEASDARVLRQVRQALTAT